MKHGVVLIRLLIAFLIFAFLISGCDVARDNPNDPFGTNYIPASGLPGSVEDSIYSKHYNKYGIDEDTYWLYIDAVISGFCPIESVNAIILDSTYSMTLVLGGINPVWKLIKLETSLPFNNVGALIGHDLFLDIYCSDGTQYTSEGLFLARVIYTEPVIIGPGGYELTSTRPTFTWIKPADIRFPFTYTIEVSFQNELNIYHTESGIPSDSTSYPCTVSLMEGDNVWWLTIVDEFGNSSVSLQNIFKATNEVTP